MKNYLIYIVLIVSAVFIVACNEDATGQASRIVQREIVEPVDCEEGWKCYSPNQVGYQLVNCSWNNLTGCAYGCNAGVCNSAPALTCADSDGGNNLFTYGWVYGINGSNNYNFTDYCAGSYVYERTCNGNVPTITGQLCSNGCSAGKCNSPTPTLTCSDSDGNDKFKFGWVYGINGSNNYNFTDFCAGSGVYERTCNGNNPILTLQSCPTGCSGGKCNAAVNTSNVSNCFDSDGGLNYGTYGFVNGTNNTVPYMIADSCGGNYLVESYCSGDHGLTQVYNCPNGCSAGKCNSAPITTCVDSDNGNFPYIAGLVNKTNITSTLYYDNCSITVVNSTLNISKVTEYYCSGTTVLNQLHTCNTTCVTTSGKGRCT